METQSSVPKCTYRTLALGGLSWTRDPSRKPAACGSWKQLHVHPAVIVKAEHREDRGMLRSCHIVVLIQLGNKKSHECELSRYTHPCEMEEWVKFS